MKQQNRQGKQNKQSKQDLVDQLGDALVLNDGQAKRIAELEKALKESEARAKRSQEAAAQTMRHMELERLQSEQKLRSQIEGMLEDRDHQLGFAYRSQILALQKTIVSMARPLSKEDLEKVYGVGYRYSFAGDGIVLTEADPKVDFFWKIPRDVQLYSYTGTLVNLLDPLILPELEQTPFIQDNLPETLPASVGFVFGQRSTSTTNELLGFKLSLPAKAKDIVVVFTTCDKEGLAAWEKQHAKAVISKSVSGNPGSERFTVCAVLPFLRNLDDTDEAETDEAVATFCEFCNQKWQDKYYGQLPRSVDIQPGIISPREYIDRKLDRG